MINPENQNSSNEKLLIKKLTHDLRNVLNNILSSVDSIKMNSISNLDSKLKMIEMNTIRAAEILEDAALDDKNILRKIGLKSVLEETANDFKSCLPITIQFKLNINIGDININGNSLRLYRVFLNLLTNAKEAIESKGSIELSAELIAESNRVQVSVIDNGIGIESENISKIFEEGFSTKSKEFDSGLGLSIVRKIIDEHNGEIKVESSRSSGTAFYITFPIEAAESLHSGNDKKILIADDETIIRELLSDLFDSMNYKTVSASDGYEAIEILKECHNIDLILLDKKMPNLGGIEALKKIRSFNNHVPVVIATGEEGDEKDLLEVKGLYQGIIRKPFRFEQLSDLINKLLTLDR